MHTLEMTEEVIEKDEEVVIEVEIETAILLGGRYFICIYVTLELIIDAHLRLDQIKI